MCYMGLNSTVTWHRIRQKDSRKRWPIVWDFFEEDVICVEMFLRKSNTLFLKEIKTVN